jgi:hypothetical protein
MANSTGKMLRRYGPIALVVVIVVAVVLIASGGGDDDEPRVTTEQNGERDPNAPRTFQEAAAEGDEDSITWGPECDTTRGRLKVPITDAAPCIEPWNASQGNGGATAQGVTADEILVAVYKGQNDPLQAALIESAGATVDPNATRDTYIGYLRMFEDIYETYGRKLRIEVVNASGGPADATAAGADAQKVIDLKPFAVVDGPTQTDVFWQRVTDAGILCLGACSLAVPWDQVEEAAPYLWPTGPAPDQADVHFAEFIGKQLAGKPVSFAGDESLNGKPRVFGYIGAETSAGKYAKRFQDFDGRLENEWNVEIATRHQYVFDASRGGEIATQAIAKMKQAGVTTVLIGADPLIPANITKEATAQNYFPEWVIGPSVLMDTTIFGRTYDQRQWRHAIGISLPAARAEREEGDSYRSWQWYYGEEPPTNSQAVIFPGPHRLLLGIHLAGPNLTPRTFEQGLFRFPPGEQGLTYAHDSWGTKTWGRSDHNSADDVTAVWWDPDAEGVSETGQTAKGMLTYVAGGKRYLPGQWPTEPLPFFEREGAVAIYEDRPDKAPDYPAWPGSPASK